MNYSSLRLDQIEARFERLLQDVQALQGQMVRALQEIRDVQTGGGGGSGTTTPLYFATNSGSVGPATGSTLTGITPAGFTSDVYTNVGGALVLQATSATVNWWYLDTLPANSIVPVLPTANAATWDAIAAGCTPL